MITKEQLQAMSDIQILRKLYELLGFEVHEYVFEEVITIQEGNKVTTTEMCPNDIMPLAFEHRIGCSTWLKSDEWMGFSCNKSVLYIIDKNPLRAIACCLILVLQEKQK